MQDLAGNLHSVIPRCFFLQDAMPMQRSAFFWTGEFVMDSDHKGISPIGLECRRGKLPIDQENTRVHAIWCDEITCNGKIIPPNYTGVWWVSVRVGVVSRIRAPWIPVRKRLTYGSVGMIQG